MWIILVAVGTFGLCFLADKVYTKFFRGKAQHRSGLSVRQNKRYGSIGLVLAVVGVAAMIAGNFQDTIMLIGGILLILVGAGLVAYYLGSGIYYDEEGFLVEALGKKRITYRYEQIAHQQLYVLQGGGIIVELHMTDGKAVQVVSNMPRYEEFLRYAFHHWCSQKGLDPENCDFYQPENNLWFPVKEDETCTSQQ